MAVGVDGSIVGVAVSVGEAIVDVVVGGSLVGVAVGGETAVGVEAGRVVVTIATVSTRSARQATNPHNNTPIQPNTNLNCKFFIT